MFWPIPSYSGIKCPQMSEDCVQFRANVQIHLETSVVTGIKAPRYRAEVCVLVGWGFTARFKHLKSNYFLSWCFEEEKNKMLPWNEKEISR